MQEGDTPNSLLDHCIEKIRRRERNFRGWIGVEVGINLDQLKNRVNRYVPITAWLPKYNYEDAISDLIAGITIGLTMIPQSIAYAALAGIGAHHGLCSAFIGSFVYVLFGTIREVSIGPTSIMALFVLEYTSRYPYPFTVLLAFIAGCVELSVGLLNLGFLIDFISEPVRSGFTSAAAIITVFAQVKGLLGLKKMVAHGFIDTLRQLYFHMSDINQWDAILGFSCIAILLLMRQLQNFPRCDENSSEKRRKINKIFWYLSLARNALCVVSCACLAYFLQESGKTPFSLSGRVEGGLPSFQLPQFYVHEGNQTWTFREMCSEIGSGLLVLPAIAILVNIAIAKAFSTGQKIDASQEMITLGLCNICGSMIQAMPTCGAFTRSAVSNASGAKTPLVGLYSGTLILLALSFLTPYFYYIPRAALSAVLISAVAFLFEGKIFLYLWNKNKRDFLICSMTFFGCLCLGLEMGLLLGVFFNASFLLGIWARPSVNIHLEKNTFGYEMVVVTPDLGLYYPCANLFDDQIKQAALEYGNGELPVAVNCRNIKGFDFTIITNMKMLMKGFHYRQQQLIFYNLSEEIFNMLTKFKVNDFPYCKTENEMFDLLFGEKLDLGRVETIPIFDKSERNDDNILHENALPLINRHIQKQID